MYIYSKYIKYIKRDSLPELFARTHNTRLRLCVTYTRAGDVVIIIADDILYTIIIPCHSAYF